MSKLLRVIVDATNYLKSQSLPLGVLETVKGAFIGSGQFGGQFVHVAFSGNTCEATGRLVMALDSKEFLNSSNICTRCTADLSKKVFALAVDVMSFKEARENVANVSSDIIIWSRTLHLAENAFDLNVSEDEPLLSLNQKLNDEIRESTRKLNLARESIANAEYLLRYGTLMRMVEAPTLAMMLDNAAPYAEDMLLEDFSEDELHGDVEAILYETWRAWLTLRKDGVADEVLTWKMRAQVQESLQYSSLGSNVEFVPQKATFTQNDFSSFQSWVLHEITEFWQRTVQSWVDVWNDAFQATYQEVSALHTSVHCLRKDLFSVGFEFFQNVPRFEKASSGFAVCFVPGVFDSIPAKPQWKDTTSQEDTLIGTLRDEDTTAVWDTFLTFASTDGQSVQSALATARAI